MSNTDAMKRRIFLFGLAAGPVLSACAPLPSANPLGQELRQTITFSEIDVTTTGAAFESGRGAEYASQLAPDLEAALRREFVDRMDPDGVPLRVDISRLNLAGSTATAFGRDQSRLQGAVRVEDRAGALIASYGIDIRRGDPAETTTGALLDAATGRAARTYRALASDFARETRVQVLGRDLPGERLLRQATN